MAKLPKPTGAELAILGVLWRGPSTVRQVHQALNAIKETGYTTVLKLMQIMHEKGLLSRDETPYALRAIAPDRWVDSTNSMIYGRFR